jgi:DnaJ-domain-containing protein 1
MQAKLFFLINAGIVLFLILRIMANLKRQKITPLRTEVRMQKRTGRPHEKALNLVFDFYGESVDAYEVLGVPAGADKPTCYRAYLDLKQHGKGDGAKLDAAWKAIQKHFMW